MMKFMAGLILSVLLFATTNAFAQTSIAVDINKAKFTWTWTPTVDSGIVNEFRMYCGPGPGQYNPYIAIAAPATEITVLSIIKQIGTYFCAVSAANQFGESLKSNEISFIAGTRPDGKLTLGVLGQ
jgi:hypothetical protein